MKFNHSIPIIITQLLFAIHLYTTTLALTSKLESETQETTTTTTTTTEKEDENYYEITQENRKIIIEQTKASLLKVLGLKEAPKLKPHKNNKVRVPQAMLREYMVLRDSVRETIPDDGDFYGKINIHELEKRHADFWTSPNYEIEIDMGSDEMEFNSFGSRRYLYKGDYERLTSFGSQGEDVPKKFEHALPPHSGGGGGGGINSQKPYISVYLKFNLSQELSSNPITTDELQAAELHLARERITNDNDEDSVSGEQEEQPVKTPNTNSNNDLSHTKSTLSSPADKIITSPSIREKRPRYQRLYLLHVLGYDQHNEPITRIHDSQIIDTHRSTPLTFDILLIVKRWIANPADNYGIIIRITNEDEEKYRSNSMQQQQQANSDDKTNASNQTTTTTTKPQLQKPQIVASSLEPAKQSSKIMEHVRLKRQFRSHSEIDEIWFDKRPTMYIFSSTPEGARRHVKRDNNRGRSPQSSTSSSTRPRNPPKKTARTAEKCSRKSLQINFEEVGWSSWIIAPNSYLANYCLGDCSYPMNDLQNATNHAIIQSIFHSVGRVVPKSCCAPTKLGNMAILYQLDGIVQMKHYDDMVVESCGCM